MTFNNNSINFKDKFKVGKIIIIDTLQGHFIEKLFSK